jgi:hypothetical protein
MTAAKRKTVNPSLTKNRRSEYRENLDYAAFIWRSIRALGRRAGHDIDALMMLEQTQAEVELAMTRAVRALRADYGHSWTDIGSRLGITRQAAQQRFGDGTAKCAREM